VRGLKALAVWCAASFGFTMAFVCIGLIVQDQQRKRDEMARLIHNDIEARNARRATASGKGVRDWGFDS
jgi:hypothetical protein